MDFSKVVGSYKSVEKCFKAWGQKRADRAADRKLASASSELTDPPELVILSKAERSVFKFFFVMKKIEKSPNIWNKIVGSNIWQLLKVGTWKLPNSILENIWTLQSLPLL